jgi:hypothetical protein
MMAIFSNESVWRIEKIYDFEDISFDLVEFNKENKQEAIKKGFKYAHLFDRNEQYNQYEYVASFFIL